MNKRHIALVLLLTAASFQGIKAQTLEEEFRNPSEDAKPIMIWQWMDGLVTKEGITADLEAYKAAGIGGVQQFLVGSETQILVKNVDNAIGTDNWRDLMRFAIDECARLGLSFGTHNCPGWSSSAYPGVQPEYSMQKIVWTSIDVQGGGTRKLSLAQPEVDPQWNYYLDIALIAACKNAAGEIESVQVISDLMDADGNLEWDVPEGSWTVYRYGQTTNGRINYATAPEGGVGLECDKMSKEAVLRFWKLYPEQILSIAGDYTGKTFQRFEIDSYEMGGQGWTKNLPAEFQARRHYDIIPWLPALTDQIYADKAKAEEVINDWQLTVRELFAEYYYGYLSELTHANGLKLIVEPYGTGGKGLFEPIDTDKVIASLDADDPVAAEFWTQPLSWGWPEVPGVVAAARRSGRETVYAEGFTCVPGYAWKDDPSGLKTIGDRAFCLGINGFMLHAGAQNPWQSVKPGMTFGQWGTQWTPGQTWWDDGASELFGYFQRCQALLRRGQFVDDFNSETSNVSFDDKAVQWIHRKEGAAEFIFAANTSEEKTTTILSFKGMTGRIPEIWNPQSKEMKDSDSWMEIDGKTFVKISLEPRESVFVVFSKDSAGKTGNGIMDIKPETLSVAEITGPWSIFFPEGWGAPASATMEKLTSWSESSDKGIKYFSGTATYKNTFEIKKITKGARYILDLGKVKNLAVVRINGKTAGTLWTAPFRIDITSFIKKGTNSIEFDVTNLWLNRMVGDEFEPEDIEWSEAKRAGAGRSMLKVPEWLEKGTPRPSKNRKTVVVYKFFTTNEPLLESGLIGPVTINTIKD